MNKNNVFILVLIIIIGVGGYLWYNDNYSFKSELNSLKNKQDSISKIRDIDYKTRDSLFENIIKINDSLINRADKIKYIPYEKHTYIDRSIDSAIIILSNYKYNTRARAKD